MFKNIIQGFKDRNKPRMATLQPLNKTIEVPSDQTLLQAALNQDITFPHHCTVGTCGNCKCKLLNGNVRAVLDFSYTLSEAEINDGFILACQSMLKDDVEIEIDVSDAVPNFPIETFHGVVKETKMLTHDIMEVSVELDRPISFSAGQFADIGLEGFERHRSYSFASTPVAEGTTELKFHVRHVSGGSYTDWLFSEDRTNERFELHGPTGNFWLRPADAPILCIAGGSGMAPIKSILEDALTKGINRPVTYLFGAREQRDLYCLDEMQALKEQWLNRFNFIPVLSEEAEDSSWKGMRGLVTDFINDDATGISLAECHAYLCGPPGMIDAALIKLEKNNVNIEQIHYDKFLDSRQLEKN